MRLLPLAEDVTRTMARSVSAMRQQLGDFRFNMRVYVQLCERVGAVGNHLMTLLAQKVICLRTAVNEKTFRH
jgi:hypothetical protein